MVANKVTLKPLNAGRPLMGFTNVFGKENSEWWGTRTWLIHSIIWLLLINGILLAVLNTPAEVIENRPDQAVSGEMIFVVMGGLMTGLGIIIVMQGAVLDEKKSGTAAWVLSKPLSRTAFILAKLAANTLAALLIMIVLQGAAAYTLMNTLAEIPPAFMAFVAGLGLMALHLLFYLTLTLMLGTLFSERGAVIGIPIGLLFGSQFLMGLAPVLAQVMPWGIIMPAGDVPALADLLMRGQPLPTVMPIIGTALLSVVFVGVALVRFEREEF
jgi:ABC-2 type transport system permease protein